VTNYEKLVRIAHTAIRSHHPEGQVYISLDYHRSAQHMQGGWDVPTFLAAFRDECVLRGDYDWAIACELYADSPAVWNESSQTDSAYYTVHSLGTLTDILTGDKYRTPEGQARGLMVSGVAIPAVAAGGTPSDEAANMQAASYAFTYMTCVQNGHVDALIYSCHTDLAAMADHRPLCGLWTVENGPDGLTVKAPRAIYDVFKQVDTNGASILSAGLSAVIGSSYTKLESALAGNAQPISLIDGKGTVGEYDKTHKKASPLFRFDGGDLQGFSDGGNLTYAELVRAETLGTVTLRARFDTEAVSDPAGMTVELPSSRIIGGKELIFDLYAGPVRTGSEGGTDKPTVTLRLTRPSKGAGSAGDGTILYEATVTDVKGGVWQTLTFDIASFTEQLDASDEVTMTLLVDYPSAETWHAATELGLAGVYITGNTAADRPSTGVVVGIVAALVVLVVVGFLFLRSRRRRY
jgi:hypothetical protein